ncbi:MAG: agmatinase, partial [Acidobacteriota bacterium]|nr:agmatinase [Acidobacteriota bacterium]
PFLEDEARGPYESSRVVVLPIPHEATVSWESGTAQGPNAILEASEHLELYDERFDREPWRAGVWTAEPLQSPDRGSVVRAATNYLDDDKWLLSLGGEHSITPWLVEACAKRHPSLTVVQLDAHADLRETFHGRADNHACAMARSLEHASAVRAFGIRAYSVEERDRMARDPDSLWIHAWEMEGDGWMERLLEGLDGCPVYLTLDLDGFDPAILPATGTPEPGGVGWDPVVRFLDRLCQQCNVVAADIVELAPRPQLHHADFLAARLAYTLIGCRFR